MFKTSIPGDFFLFFLCGYAAYALAQTLSVITLVGFPMATAKSFI